MPPEKHAILSASSAARWLHCPGSVPFAKDTADTESRYSAAGTLAHAICEAKARAYFEKMPKRTLTARLKKLRAEPDYDKGMESSSELYLNFLKETALAFFAETPFVAIEARVDYSDYAPEGFGTADCVMIGGGKLHVVDYKNGAGVAVPAEENAQMMLYALGACQTYRIIYGDSIQEFYLTIVQPNAGGIKTWTCDRKTLLTWGETVVKPAAALAWSGAGECVPGPWCESTFCPAKAVCSARARELLALEQERPPEDGPMLTDEQIGGILARAQDLEAWVRSLKEYALNTCLAGGSIPGYKAVEGRGLREWTDTDAALAALRTRGVPEAMLYKREPVSVAGLEKLLGKSDFAKTADGLVTKRPGKPTLVPESDPRQAVNAAALAFHKEN